MNFLHGRRVVLFGELGGGCQLLYLSLQLDQLFGRVGRHFDVGVRVEVPNRQCVEVVLLVFQLGVVNNWLLGPVVVSFFGLLGPVVFSFFRSSATSLLF